MAGMAARSGGGDTIAEPRHGDIGYFAAGTNPAQFLPADPRRSTLLLFGNNAVRLTFNVRGGFSIDQGVTFQQTSGPVEITLEKHGDIVTKEWWVIAPTANNTFGYLTTSAES